MGPRTKGGDTHIHQWTSTRRSGRTGQDGSLRSVDLFCLKASRGRVSATKLGIRIAVDMLEVAAAHEMRERANRARQSRPRFTASDKEDAKCGPSRSPTKRKGGRKRRKKEQTQRLAYADTAYAHNIEGAEFKSGSRQGRMRPRTFPPLRLSASPSSFAKGRCASRVRPGRGDASSCLSLNLPPPLGTFQRQVGRGFESVEDQPMLYGLAQTSFNLLLSPPRPRFSYLF